MPLHRLSSYTYAVPDVDTVLAYYREFGLSDNGDGSLATVDGGTQLHIERGPVRKITKLTLGADDPDDLARIQSRLASLGVAAATDGATLRTGDPVTGVAIDVVLEPRDAQPEIVRAPVNGPGRVERVNSRADGITRADRVRPRKLGHVALMSADSAATMAFFVDGLGFKVSDYAGDRTSGFLRCSPDHHNVAIFSGPASFPHHSSWQVDDVDDVGRGAEDLLEADDGRNVWGFGRHYAGSNFFWYLKDPAGTFSEYYADMDYIADDDLWTPQVCSGKSGLYRWGPVPGDDFMSPADVAEIIAAQSG